jgi:predicted transposase YbfD/YdcC
VLITPISIVQVILEIRHFVMLSNIQELIAPEHKWLNLYSIGMMNSWRTENVKTTFETRYFISSLSTNSELLAQSICNHWTIENVLH